MSVRRRRSAGAPVDLTTRVGSVVLANPVMTASGTSGHGAELSSYFDLSSLGAVVVKSLSPGPWSGNPAPRVHETTVGMMNAVGLQGPGVEAWLERDLPPLLATGAKVVASIWGRSVGEYESAAAMLGEAPDAVVAVEVNLSCPNVEARADVFAHSADAIEQVMTATAVCRRPRWAKLSPNVTDLVAMAGAARRGGAEAVTLVNTVMALAIDLETRRPSLAMGGGGLSGRAIHPIAVRAVHDVHTTHPDLPIVGVGGVASAADAVELLLAGAAAVQVGTATFADPRAPARVQRGLEDWCRRHRVQDVGELIGAVDDHQRN